MAANTIPAARQALYDLLTGEFAADDVLVADGFPRQRAERMVILGGVVSPESGVAATADWHGIGGQRRRQTYVLEVRVDVYDSGAGDGQDVAVPMWELVDRVHAVVHSDVTLGIDDLIAHVSGVNGGEPMPVAEGGYGAVVYLDVNITATVTSV